MRIEGSEFAAVYVRQSESAIRRLGWCRNFVGGTVATMCMTSQFVADWQTCNLGIFVSAFSIALIGWYQLAPEVTHVPKCWLWQNIFLFKNCHVCNDCFRCSAALFIQVAAIRAIKGWAPAQRFRLRVQVYISIVQTLLFTRYIACALRTQKRPGGTCDLPVLLFGKVLWRTICIISCVNQLFLKVLPSVIKLF